MDAKDVYKRAAEITQKGIDQYEAEKKQKQEETARQPMDAKTVYEEASRIVRDVIDFADEGSDYTTKAILAVGRTIVEAKRLEFYERALEKLSEMMAEKQSPPVAPFMPSVDMQQFKPGGKFFGKGYYAPGKESEAYPEMPPTIRADYSLKATDHIILYRNQYGSRMVILYDFDEDRDRELKRIETEGGLDIEFYHTAEAVGKETLELAQRLEAVVKDEPAEGTPIEEMKRQALADEDAAMRQQQEAEEE